VNTTRFTVRQLEAFVTVADEASFAAASRRLGLSASAVSQVVAELEGILGFRLFERTTRRVRLSAAGGVFLGTARAVLRRVIDAEKIASDLRNRAAGIVPSAMVGHSIGEYVAACIAGVVADVAGLGAADGPTYFSGR
jgi:DNA-binding transcriptional LysR family regulator